MMDFTGFFANKLSAILLVVLVITCCQQLALMTLIFIRDPVGPYAEMISYSVYEHINQPLSKVITNQSAINAALLLGSHVNANDVKDGNQLLKTRLNIQLSGILVSSLPTRSIAIISRNGQQQSVQIGDVIQGTDAQVKQILPDCVIITRQQQQEVLWLDDETTPEK